MCQIKRAGTRIFSAYRLFGAYAYTLIILLPYVGVNIAKNNDLSEQINSGLSDIDVRYNSETGAPEWSPRGADTWSPFRNEPVLLWKGTGAKQNNITCTFDYSPYTHIRIDFKDSKSLFLKCGTTPIVLAEWSAYYSNSIGRRLISFISSGITCNTLDASGNGGAYMIPLAIYGIK